MELNEIELRIATKDEIEEKIFYVKSLDVLKDSFDIILENLNDIDKKIFYYIMSREKDLNYLRNNSIDIDIFDLIRNVFNKECNRDFTKYYNHINESLTRIIYTRTIIVSKNFRTNFSLLSRVGYNSNKEKLIVEVDEYIKDEVIKRHINNIYNGREKFGNYKYENLFNTLHEKRLEQELDNKILVRSFGCYYFLNDFKDEYQLDKALKFILDKKLILDAYRIEKDEIILKFKKMTKEEIEDFKKINIFPENYI